MVVRFIRLKGVDGLVNIVGRQHFAAGRIYFQDDGLHVLVITGAVELRLNHVHQIVARLVIVMAGNNSVHGDDGDFILRRIVFQKAFLQFGSDFARAGGFEIMVEAQRMHGELPQDN